MTLDTNPELPSNEDNILLYETESGDFRMEVRLVDETVWLSLNQMAELFQRDKSSISKHIKSIFEEVELEKDSVVAKYATTAADLKTYQVEHERYRDRLLNVPTDDEKDYIESTERDLQGHREKVS